MRPIRSLALLFVLLAAPALRADVTVRYKVDFKTQQAAAGNAKTPGSQKSPLPASFVIQIKGDKGYSSIGAGASFVDFTKQEITVMDATDKLFATELMKDYMSGMFASAPAPPAIPPAAQKILETIKTNFSSRKTGRTDTVMGVQVEESECTITIDMPLPPGLPLPPGEFPPGQDITLVKIVMQFWTATQPEFLRVPALDEWTKYTSSSIRLLNPGAAIQQSIAKLPGLGDGLMPMFDELLKGKYALLKAHADFYVPVLAQVMPLLPPQQKSQLPPGFDPHASLAEVNLVVTELSTAPLDDSVFKVPSDYRETTMPELVKALKPAPAAPKQPANPQ